MFSQCCSTYFSVGDCEVMSASSSMRLCVFPVLPYIFIWWWFCEYARPLLLSCVLVLVDQCPLQDDNIPSFANVTHWMAINGTWFTPTLIWHVIWMIDLWRFTIICLMMGIEGDTFTLQVMYYVVFLCYRKCVFNWVQSHNLFYSRTINIIFT